MSLGPVAVLTYAGEARQTAPTAKGLEVAWSLVGMWSGVAADERSGTLYALDRFGRCVELDSKGELLRQISLPRAGSRLRLARFRHQERPTLLKFTAWLEELRAFDSDGKELWSYGLAGGIDDVWAADLNGDGTDEVIVGFNGGTGLHVLDSEGQLLWKSVGIANVWHVCAGNVWGGDTAQVVTTSAAGDVHVFSSDGTKRTDLATGCYATMVCVGKVSDQDKEATIFAAGSPLGIRAMLRGEVVAALTSDGRAKWSLRLPAGNGMDVISASLAPTRPWLAIGMRNGDVHVVDAQTGKLIASTRDPGADAEVAWATPGGTAAPLLLVATGRKLNAFRVTEAE